MVAKKKGKPTKKKSSAKKTSVKKKVAKPTPVTIHMPKQQEPTVSKIMIENFVSLQRVLTNLSTKMEELTNQISKLLNIFEISAKSLAEKEFEIEKENKDTLEKLNKLLDQNKILARGVSLMHERMPPEQFPHPQPQMQPPQNIMQKNTSPFPPPFQQPKISFGQPNNPKKTLTQETPESNNLGEPSIMSKNQPQIQNNFPKIEEIQSEKTPKSNFQNPLE